jgi:hypothetical protein
MLLNTAVVIGIGLVALRFAIIAALCFAFWRWLKLRALLWVGTWYIGGFVAGIIGAHFYLQCVSPVWRPDSHTRPPPATSGLITAMNLAAEISALLAVLLIFSEAAVIMRRLYPDIQPVALRFLVRSYSHVFALGVACVFLGVAGPLLPLLYCYGHAHQ